MAISSKIEEIIFEITKTAGNIYDALKLGIGNANTPKSSIFELNNLLSVAQNGIPYFGVIETNPLGFGITYDFTLDQYNLIVKSGQIGYNNSIIQIPQQKIPINKEFIKDYDTVGLGSTGFRYGINIGFPISEAQKTEQVWNTTVSETSLSGTNILYISDTAIPSTLGFPLEANVGALLIKFKDYNSEKTGLIIDPSYYNGTSYGVLPYDILASTPVKFIFSPRLKYITGFPIETTNDDPVTFQYYPPIPKDWLDISKVLIADPKNPRIAGVGYASLVRTAVDLPTQNSSNPILGDSTDINQVIASTNTAITALSKYQSSSVIMNTIQAVSSYTATLSSDGGYSTRKYWSLQPFRPTQYYSKGLSFSGLERFEFPYNFSEAYYLQTNEDLQHTFAIFRGDLVTNNIAVLGNNSVSSIGCTVIPVSNYQSSMSTGTRVYGASVVSNISLDEYGESIPTYTNIISSNFTTNNYLVELNWTGSGVSNPLFYNIYKRPNLSTELVESKLTQIDEILYPPSNTITSITPNSSYNFSNKNIALKFTTNEDCFIGGISVKLSFTSNDKAGVGSTGLGFYLYGDNGSFPDSTNLLANGSVLRFYDINVGENDYTVKFTNGANLSAGTDYWVVINKEDNFVTTNESPILYIKTLNSGSGKLFYSDLPVSSSVWTNVTQTGYLKLRGYLGDGNTTGTLTRKGVKLTNTISHSPRRLSVYVPPVENIINNFGLILSGNDSGIAYSTDTTIKNDLIVTVTAKLGASGTANTFTATVPQGTIRDTRYLLGNSTDLFDRVIDVVVTPGTNLNRINNGPIIWDIYDLITVETEP